MSERTLTGRAASPTIQAQRQAAPAAHAAHPMLRLVAHELRAHITVLGGYCELFDESAVRDDRGRRRVALEAIRAQLDALREMAAHLTEAVDPNATDGLAYQATTVDLAAAASEAVRFCGDAAAARNIELRCDTAQLASPLVDGDHFHLVTAMRNLVENACRYGPHGGQVRLSVTRQGGEVEVLVHDQGSGLRMVGADAFQPYTRGGDADEVAPAGLGLGLSLVAQVARMHGGTPVWGNDKAGAMIGFRFAAPPPTA